MSLRPSLKTTFLNLNPLIGRCSTCEKNSPVHGAHSNCVTFVPAGVAKGPPRCGHTKCEDGPPKSGGQRDCEAITRGVFQNRNTTGYCIGTTPRTSFIPARVAVASWRRRFFVQPRDFLPSRAASGPAVRQPHETQSCADGRDE